MAYLIVTEIENEHFICQAFKREPTMGFIFDLLHIGIVYDPHSIVGHLGYRPLRTPSGRIIPFIKTPYVPHKIHFSLPLFCDSRYNKSRWHLFLESGFFFSLNWEMIWSLQALTSSSFFLYANDERKNRSEIFFAFRWTITARNLCKYISIFYE